MKESIAEMESNIDCSEDMSTPTLRTVPLPVQIVEQDRTQLGETNKEEQEPCSSPKCKVEIRYFKYKMKPHRYTVVKPKKVKEIITPEIRMERNRYRAIKYRYRKRFLKRILKSKNPSTSLTSAQRSKRYRDNKNLKNPPMNPKPNPLTSAQRSKRYRDKKKE